MASSNTLVQSILQQVDAPNIMEQVQAALQQEQAERKRFYEMVDENRKMEFINGKIVFQSPVKKRHNTATGYLYRILSSFADLFDLGFTGIEKIMISLTRNDYEPDICFWTTKHAKNFTDDQMQFPAPDFVAEVLSKSTEKNDREIKFQDYANHGIAEYWIVSPKDHSIEQYKLVRGHYELIFKASEGTIKSFTIKGFEIPIASVFNKKANLQALQVLLSKPPK
jgi:Uma2 family endonuclease